MPLNHDDFINRHLRAIKPDDTREWVKYDVEELHELVKMSVKTFQNEGSLVKLNPPCVFVGDLHGQYLDLLTFFRMFNTETEENRYAPGALSKKYVFLGNYIGSRPDSLETLCLILALKTVYPTRYAVLRGNNECENISSANGLRNTLIKRFGGQEGEKLFNEFNDVFSWMPLACVTGQKILCVHGGLSPHLKSLGDIEKIERPLKDVKKVPLAVDLLCADPTLDDVGFLPNETTGISCYFGEKEVNTACKDMGLRLIVRSKQMMMSGFGYFADRKLLSLFSAPRFHTDPVENEKNSGAVMYLNEGGIPIIHVLRPTPEGNRA